MTDAYIHVEARPHAGTAGRDLLARTFGLVADLPPTVRAGCGAEVPRAMTAARPEAVTCPECRVFGREQNRRVAEFLAQHREPVGLVGLDDSGMTNRIAWHRDQSRRFRSADDDGGDKGGEDSGEEGPAV